MKFKLYTAFAFVGIASAVVALIRIAEGQDPQEVIPVNIVMGSFCFGCMLLLMYKERRKIERRT